MEGRIRWLELLKAVNGCLPSDPPRKAGDDAPAMPIAERKELHITNLDCQQVEDVSQWYAGVKQWDTPVADAGSCRARPCRADSRAPGAQGVVPKPPGGLAPVPRHRAACQPGGRAVQMPPPRGPRGPVGSSRSADTTTTTASPTNQGARIRPQNADRKPPHRAK